jgi:hypothetical protein
MNFQECTTETIDKLIVIAEHGKQFTIQNENKISVKQVKVDGCLIKDERKRCDYLFEIEKKSLVIYLELKGKNVGHAYEQLVSTIEFCLTRHKNLERRCYIIASRVPSTTATMMNLKAKILKNYKATTIVTRKGEINI